MSSLLCFPGLSQPNAPLDETQLAKRFGVSAEQVSQWLSLGLPRTSDDRIDPFECCNWLSWGHLEKAPALKRLWRQFVAHFRSFANGSDTGRHLEWNREVVLYLPEHASATDWYICKMQSDFSWQQHTVINDISALGTVQEDERYYKICTDEIQPHARMAYQLQIKPQRVLDHSDNAFKELFPLFTEIIDAFKYIYRIHELHDSKENAGLTGTCLDCALYSAKIFEERGYQTRLVGGVIGHSALLNAHHWIEVETSQGWAPLDASIPAIIRMLGEDWEPWAKSYCGGLDSGRIALTRGPGFWDVPEQNFVSAATGAATTEIDQQRLNAWPCIDWVCGECDGSISV